VLIIDEIQEFLNINPSIFSDMKELWDRYLGKSQVLLIFMGSIHSLMHKIFEDAKEPLFGRADRVIHLAAFTIAELKAINKLWA
jgi:AAA+ ATPase superfamily predicted ATPase